MVAWALHTKAAGRVCDFTMYFWTTMEVQGVKVNSLSLFTQLFGSICFIGDTGKKKNNIQLHHLCPLTLNCSNINSQRLGATFIKPVAYSMVVFNPVCSHISDSILKGIFSEGLES